MLRFIIFNSLKLVLTERIHVVQDMIIVMKDEL